MFITDIFRDDGVRHAHGTNVVVARISVFIISLSGFNGASISGKTMGWLTVGLSSLAFTMKLIGSSLKEQLTEGSVQVSRSELMIHAISTTVIATFGALSLMGAISMGEAAASICLTYCFSALYDCLLS